MKLPVINIDLTVDFRVAVMFGVAIAGLVFMTPFSINNFFQGRVLLGFGSLGIILFLAINAWLAGKGRYHAWLTFIGLVPSIIFFLVVALREQDIIGALWCYPAVIAFYAMLPERKAWFANLALLCIAIPQAWLVLDHAVAVRVAVTLVVVSTFSGIFVRVITVQQSRLQTQALTDSLTGLANRVELGSVLEQAVEQNRRSGVPMTLLALDLDRFKEVNDTMGHDAGDLVLKTVAEQIRKRIRIVDKAFRLGGEEFLILLYDADLESGVRTAEAIRQEIAARKILAERVITLSIGVATLDAGENWQAWMKRSDENLFRAKTMGRNRVVA